MVLQARQQMLESKKNLGKIKDSTYFRSLETLKRLASIYNTPIQSCSALQIQNFLLGESKYSQSVINKECIMLNGIFKYAIKHKIISGNTMEDVERPRSTQKKVKVRGLTVDERKNLLHLLRKTVFVIPLKCFFHCLLVCVWEKLMLFVYLMLI